MVGVMTIWLFLLFPDYIVKDGIEPEGQSFAELPYRPQAGKALKWKVHGVGPSLSIQGKRKSRKGCALRAVYDNQIY